MIARPWSSAAEKHCYRCALWSVVIAIVLGISAPASDWQKKVPAADSSAPNPLAADTGAASAGAQTYAQKCAKCHGATGEGKGSHPSLRTPKVQKATAGELNWIITHGNRMHGMPAFVSLSDTERWQLVSYIKSLPSGADEAPSPK